MDYRFKIGEVAGIFDISIRALRLYDKLDIIKPSLVDEKTGYRYYTTEQINELRTLVCLKSVGLSLDEIKAVLDDDDAPAKLLDILSQKKQSWLDQIEIAKLNVKLIADMEKNAMEQLEKQKDTQANPEQRARRLSKLVSMENPKIVSELSEVIWL